MTLREARINPADCALVVAIPLTKEELFGDLDEGAPKDFAKSVARRWPGMRRDVLWEDHYRPEAELVTRVMADVQAHGATVARGVTLDGLRAVLSRHAAVTLVAHWRFSPIAPDDVLDAAEIVRAISEPRCLVSRHVRERLDATHPRLTHRNALAGADPAALRAALATALNGLLEPARRHYQDRPDRPPTGGRELAAPPVRLTRVALEEAFPSALRGGLAVELHDRLHRVADVVDAVPIDFDGVIDLSVCNSTILGEAIKRRRRRCLVVVNERPARLSFRMIRYQFIIRELAREPPGRYTDVMIRLSESVLQ